jgi:hypothetical protein
MLQPSELLAVFGPVSAIWRWHCECICHRPMPGKDEPGKTEARYANHFEIAFSQFEFLLDFGQSYGEEQPIQPHTRVVTGPAYVAMLLGLLQKSVDNYQSEYGAIQAAKRIGDD